DARAAVLQLQAVVETPPAALTRELDPVEAIGVRVAERAALGPALAGRDRRPLPVAAGEVERALDPLGRDHDPVVRVEWELHHGHPQRVAGLDPRGKLGELRRLVGEGELEVETP